MNHKDTASIRKTLDETAAMARLLEQVCRQILHRLGATSCALSQFDPEREVVSTLVTYSLAAELEPPEHLEAREEYALADYPATRRVLQERVAIGVRRDDPAADPAEQAFLEEAGQQALLMLPLAVEGRSIGLLEIYQRDRPRTFTPDEIALAQALADQAALVLESGHLFEGVRQEARDLNFLIEANAAVAGSLDLETVLRRLVEQLTRLIAVEECVFSRWDPEQGTISTWAKSLRGETTVWPPTDTTMVERLADFPLTARVLQERAPAVVQRDDPQADPAERALLAELSLQSLLMLPMVAYDRVVGLVELREGRQRREFSPREITLAQALVNHSAIAIENARLFREREQRLVEMAILNTLGQAISAPLDLESLFKTVHEQVGRVFDATNFFIALYEEGSAEWLMGYQVEHGVYRPGGRHPLGVGVTGHIIRTRQPILLRTMAEADAWDEAHGVPLLGEQSKSWMGVPMLSADKILGVMAIQSYEHEYLYDEQDLALFSTIATQVANALDNIQLLEETRRRARELETINEVGRAITSVLDLDALLTQIVEITKTRFGYYFCCAALVEGDTLVFRARSTIGATGVPLQAGVGRIPIQAERSLVAEAARTGRPVIVNDVLSTPHYLAVDELPDTRAELDVPIIFQDRVIGVLDVQSDRPGAFDEQQVALLQALVSQAGVAIENARLFAQRERQLTEMATLNEIGRTLASTLDLDQLARALHGQTGRLFDTANFYVALYDETQEEWETLLDIIHGEAQPSARYSVREGLTGHIIRQRIPLLFHTAEDLARYMQEHKIPVVGEMARSWMGVPMIAADQVVGVIAVESYDAAHAYSEADLAVFSTIAAQAAIAFQNARFFRESRLRAEQLAALFQMSTTISSTLDLDQVLQAVCGWAVRLLQSTSAYVCQWDAATRSSTVIAEAYSPEASAPERVSDIGVTYRERAYVAACLERGQPYTMRRSDPALPEEERAMLAQYDGKSVLCLPLIARGQTIGYIDVWESRYDRTYTEEEILLGQNLAGQAAVAIENARLYMQIQQQVEELRRANETQALLWQQVREMSIPVIPLQDRVLVLPLVGTIDSARARDLTDRLLAAVRQTRALVILLDITGVPVVDTAVAQAIIQAATAARLLGAEVVLVGVRSEVAQTLVTLGVSMEGLVTKSNLQTGIAYALGRVGLRIVPEELLPGKR